MKYNETKLHYHIFDIDLPLRIKRLESSNFEIFSCSEYQTLIPTSKEVKSVETDYKYILPHLLSFKKTWSKFHSHLYSAYFGDKNKDYFWIRHEILSAIDIHIAYLKFTF